MFGLFKRIITGTTIARDLSLVLFFIALGVIVGAGIALLAGQ